MTDCGCLLCCLGITNAGKCNAIWVGCSLFESGWVNWVPKVHLALVNLMEVERDIPRMAIQQKGGMWSMGKRPQFTDKGEVEKRREKNRKDVQVQEDE